MFPKFKIVGYYSLNRNDDFCFVAPVFRSGDSCYLSRINRADSTIIEFVLLDDEIQWQPEEISLPELSKGDESVYLFLFRGKLVAGDRNSITLQLFKLMRSEKLKPLELYDIYHFIGDIENVTKAVRDFIAANRELRLGQHNFTKPTMVDVGIDEFAKAVFGVATILEYHKSLLPYEAFFSNRLGKISFFRYTIEIRSLLGKFDSLVQRHNSPIYRDLIVLCYAQNRLARPEVKNHPEYKLRQLFIVRPERIYALRWDEEIFRNSQGLKPMNFNALEKSNLLARDVAEELKSAGTRKQAKTARDVSYYNLIAQIKQGAL